MVIPRYEGIQSADISKKDDLGVLSTWGAGSKRTKERRRQKVKVTVKNTEIREKKRRVIWNEEETRTPAVSSTAPVETPHSVENEENNVRDDEENATSKGRDENATSQARDENAANKRRDENENAPPPKRRKPRTRVRKTDAKMETSAENDTQKLETSGETHKVVVESIPPPEEHQDSSAALIPSDEKDEFEESMLASLEAVRAALAPAVPVKTVQKSEVAVDWTNRYVVLEDKRLSVDSLEDLHPDLRRALIAEDFHTFFPVQSCVVPFLLKSVTEGWVDPLSKYACDVAVAAPTGQGKTLCYLIPMLHAVWNLTTNQTRGIVCVPTRDLAHQVAAVARRFSAHLPRFRVALLTGASDFQAEKKQLHSKPDLVVCTPGRLVDHIMDEDRALDLSRLRWFVADEADRLLSEDYQRWLQALQLITHRGLPPTPQATLAWPLGQRSPLPPLRKWLFSATVTKNPQKLSALQLELPFFFLASKTGAHAVPETLTHEYICCGGPKVLQLLRFSRSKKRVLVFCAAVETAHRLARLMEIYYACDSENEKPVVREFSSVLQQWERERMLKQFVAGKIHCLVCSDVAARGIDLPEVEAVVNYDVPKHLRTYVHRVGRTARAGKSGLCMTLVFQKEMFHFKKMIRKSDFGWERLKRAEGGLEDMGMYHKACRLLRVCVEEEEEGLRDIREEIDISQLQASYDKHRSGVEEEEEDEEEEKDEEEGKEEEEKDDEEKDDEEKDEEDEEKDEENEDSVESAVSGENSAVKPPPRSLRDYLLGN